MKQKEIQIKQIEIQNETERDGQSKEEKDKKEK